MEKEEIRQEFGGKIVADPYPYNTPDAALWLKLLGNASKKSISLYGKLMFLRGVGARLEKSEKFGYVIKPLIREGRTSWGWPSVEQWNKDKAILVPYADTLSELLKAL